MHGEPFCCDIEVLDCDILFAMITPDGRQLGEIRRFNNSSALWAMHLQHIFLPIERALFRRDNWFTRAINLIGRCNSPGLKVLV